MRVVLAACAAIAALTLAGSAGAGSQSYLDPGGDSAGADISGVSVVTDPAAGTITFQVQTSLGGWEPNTFLAVLIDADQNPATGSSGFDYVAAADAQGGTLINISHPYVTQESSTMTNGLWTETIHASDIGNPSAFDFFVLTQTGPDPRNPLEDRAPDAGTWTYPAAPPPPPPPPPAPTVVSAAATWVGTPVHGKAFRIGGIAVTLSDGSRAAASGVACTATLGGKAIPARGCVLRLPKTAKGRRLVVRVAGTYGAAPVGGTYAFRVR
jgi:hypothetical protein